jgi:hypothetical protein
MLGLGVIVFTHVDDKGGEFVVAYTNPPTIAPSSYHGLGY